MVLDYRLLAFPCLVCWLTCMGCAQEDDPGVQVQGPGFKLRVFNNSETLGQIITVNAAGAALGMKEVPSENNTIFSQVYFYNDGQKSIELPSVEKFSNVEVHALSDNGWAVGYASREIGHPDGSLSAIVWDCNSNQVTRLPTLPDDNACQAQDISSDGTRISGYSTGSSPARLRPVVWMRQETSGDDTDAEGDAHASVSWVPTELSSIEKLNPYLMSSKAVISPDGQRVAACITEAFLPNGLVDSSLYVWDYADDHWTRKQISKEQFKLQGVNNRGEIVGNLSSPSGKIPCHISLEGKVTQIELLPEDVAGEAWGINSAGTIVGFSDDPTGPEGGPVPFVWQNGQTRPLPLPKSTVFGMAFDINDKGQVAGLADFTLEDETIENPETGEQVPVEKTLGFIWSPAQK